MHGCNLRQRRNSTTRSRETRSGHRASIITRKTSWGFPARITAHQLRSQIFQLCDRLRYAFLRRPAGIDIHTAMSRELGLGLGWTGSEVLFVGFDSFTSSNPHTSFYLWVARKKKGVSQAFNIANSGIQRWQDWRHRVGSHAILVCGQTGDGKHNVARITSDHDAGGEGNQPRKYCAR